MYPRGHIVGFLAWGFRNPNILVCSWSTILKTVLLFESCRLKSYIVILFWKTILLLNLKYSNFFYICCLVIATNTSKQLYKLSCCKVLDLRLICTMRSCSDITFFPKPPNKAYCAHKNYTYLNSLFFFL